MPTLMPIKAQNNDYRNQTASNGWHSTGVDFSSQTILCNHGYSGNASVPAAEFFRYAAYMLAIIVVEYLCPEYVSFPTTYCNVYSDLSRSIYYSLKS